MHTRKIVAVALCFMILLTCSFFYVQPSQGCETYVSEQIAQIISELNASLADLDSLKGTALPQQLKDHYFLARQHYKHIEGYVEYYSPFDVKYFINGPLVKKSELEYGKKIFDPHGFQVIEELLFSGDSLSIDALRSEYVLLAEVFRAFNKKNKMLPVKNTQVLELVQFELVRIMGLTLNGYDATYTKTNVEECAWSLEGCRDLLDQVKAGLPATNVNALKLQLGKAIAYCRQHPNSDHFDRLFFITRYMNPLYGSLYDLHRQGHVPYTPVNYAVNLRSGSFFAKNGFNLDFFSVKVNDTTGLKRQAKLGQLLFFDPVLSGNNQRACASCHKPELGFTDGLQKAIEFGSRNNLDRNTPTLLNVIYQRNFFYDGRARQLEQQVNDVLHNQREMNSTIDDMVRKLNESAEYKALFRNAYYNTADTSIGYYGILKAITEYEKTLVSRSSRFDKYLCGDYSQLKPNEINGYNLFAGKALCGSCHFFPLFNGLVPPVYNDTEYEVIGVPATTEHKAVDPDEGRKIVSQVEIHRYAFKTPTVRNVALTGPYMHNGIYKTLDEVIDFYNKGGGQGLGIDLPHQTLPFDSLQLSRQEMKNIKAFMLSLTDTSGLLKRPARLPSFPGQELNKRPVGGNY